MNLQALEGMSNLLHFSTIHIILQSHHSKVQKYQQGKMCLQFFEVQLELLSKELNHLAAILQHYAGGLIFMKFKKKMEILLHF